jgi:hypothetical protein
VSDFTDAHRTEASLTKSNIIGADLGTAPFPALAPIAVDRVAKWFWSGGWSGTIVLFFPDAATSLASIVE